METGSSSSSSNAAAAAAAARKKQIAEEKAKAAAALEEDERFARRLQAEMDKEQFEATISKAKSAKSSYMSSSQASSSKYEAASASSSSSQPVPAKASAVSSSAGPSSSASFSHESVNAKTPGVKSSSFTTPAKPPIILDDDEFPTPEALLGLTPNPSKIPFKTPGNHSSFGSFGAGSSSATKAPVVNSSPGTGSYVPWANRSTSYSYAGTNFPSQVKEESEKVAVKPEPGSRFGAGSTPNSSGQSSGYIPGRNLPVPTVKREAGAVPVKSKPQASSGSSAAYQKNDYGVPLLNRVKTEPGMPGAYGAGAYGNVKQEPGIPVKPDPGVHVKPQPAGYGGGYGYGYGGGAPGNFGDPMILPHRDEDDIFERPLNEKDVEKQLKNLLENVALTTDVPPPERRIPSPPELKVTLLAHQKIGVDWMVKMEQGNNKGGILADDMGLGKTIQSIATIILNRSDVSSRKTTLIVAPTSLILQWESELKEKVKPGTFKGGICVYYGKNRKGKTANSLKKYDIVITTYGILAMEWPTAPKKAKKENTYNAADRKAEDDRVFELELKEEKVNEISFNLQKGELFKMRFHRIILDEAHTIKNKATRAARACSNLKADHRWCLSGTPFQNNIGELYSLLNFLDIEPYCDWVRFRDDIEKPFKQGRHKKVLKRVQALLKAVCLRRTKTSELDGKPIIVLPPKAVDMVEVDFTPEEREFYTSLEQKTLLRFNQYLRAGTVMQNYTNVLVLLLRMFNNQTPDNHVMFSLRQAWYVHFTEAPPELLAAAEAEEEAKRALEGGVAPEPTISPWEMLTPEIIKRVQDLRDYDCPICVEPPTYGALIPQCGHVFCIDCITEHLNSRSSEGEKDCPTCRGKVQLKNLIKMTDFEKRFPREPVFDEEVDGVVIKRKRLIKDDDEDDDIPTFSKIKISEKGKEKVRDVEKLELEEFISSTKIDNFDSTIRVLTQWQRDNPGEKTIIFSQFRGMLDLLETPLRDRKIKYVRYDGSMTADQRDEAVKTLQNNSDVENQAIDRVHRFGQTKEVYVNRIAIRGTVEQRILQLQREKQ
ncbi:hypothetical protein HDU76_006440, partial [Blyttiomyces sp. JEL0837]